MTLRVLCSAFVFLISAPCFAHLELGEYRGVGPNGEACSFKVLSMDYIYNLEHPLNERATIEVAGTTLTLGHLPQVDAERNRVGFDRDHLTGVQGTTYGAFAAVLGMDHSSGHHGPTALTLIHHDYKDAAATSKTTCSGLRHD